METVARNEITDEASTGTAELARFFPAVEPVRVRATVKPSRGAGTAVRETVTVEFASAENAIFLSALPLEFNDLVQLQSSESERSGDARVVAVQYHDGRKAVAIQFANALTSWVKRP